MIKICDAIISKDNDEIEFYHKFAKQIFLSLWDNFIDELMNTDKKEIKGFANAMKFFLREGELTNLLPQLLASETQLLEALGQLFAADNWKNIA